jgi:signal transduction histidine kinase
MLGAALLTCAVIAVDDWLPTLVVSETAFSATAGSVTAIALVVAALALIFVWRRRTSVLDQWLLVALSAFVAEAPIIIFLGASRYTSAFYSSRLLALLASCAVLVALLSEMTRLYVRLSTAVKALQRERATKLMNLDVVVSSIGHEIRQPLTVIRMSASVIDALLRKPRIEVDEVRENLDEVASSAVRIAETIDSLRGLFRNRHEDEQRVDVNELVRECLHTLNGELVDRGIVLTCRSPWGRAKADFCHIANPNRNIIANRNNSFFQIVEVFHIAQTTNDVFHFVQLNGFGANVQITFAHGFHHVHNRNVKSF